MFVSSGTTLKWDGVFASWSFDTLSLDDAMSQVSVYLKNNYNLVVTDYNDTLSGDLGDGDLVVTLQTGMDRGDTGADNGVDDIKSNVDDAFSHLQTFGATPPNLTSSSCKLNLMMASDGGGGPAYHFSPMNLLPSWLGGSPVTASQQAQYTAEGQAQIRSVATNATAGGYSQSAQQTAQTSANTQSNQFASDESALARKQNAEAAGKDKWILYGLIAAAGLVALVIALPYIGAARSAGGA